MTVSTPEVIAHIRETALANPETETGKVALVLLNALDAAEALASARPADKRLCDVDGLGHIVIPADHPARAELVSLRTALRDLRAEVRAHLALREEGKGFPYGTDTPAYLDWCERSKASRTKLDELTRP